MPRSRVIVEFPDRPAYPVRIGAGVAGELGAQARALAPDAERCLVICDSDAKARCLPAVRAGLAAAGFRVADITVAPVAPDQAWECVGEIHRALAGLGLPAGSPAVVCAGVEAGQLAAFAMSLYGGGDGHPLAVVPASLAAAVSLLGVDRFELDAGLDAPLCVMARPALGVIDPALLDCPDAGEAEAGLFELEQASLHCDGEYRRWQDANMAGISSFDPDACVLALTQVLADRADAIGLRLAR